MKFRLVYALVFCLAPFVGCGNRPAETVAQDAGVEVPGDAVSTPTQGQGAEKAPRVIPSSAPSDAAAPRAKKSAPKEGPHEKLYTPDQLALLGADPREGRVETELRHDFDGDGLDDLALVLVSPHEEKARTLVIGLRTPEGFRAVQRSMCVALCAECGGVLGDPYYGMKVVGERSVKVTNHGGSRWAWANAYTIAWRKDGFYVVGADLSYYDRLKNKSEAQISVNLLTMKYSRTGKPGLRPHNEKPFPISDCGAVEGLQLDAFP